MFLKLIIKISSFTALWISAYFLYLNEISYYFYLICIPVIAIALDLSLSHNPVFQNKKSICTCLELWYEMMEFPKNSEVRITIYKPRILHKQTLKQYIRYIPTNEYGSMKRGLTLSKGIVGKCFREKKGEIDRANKGINIKTFLMENYGFTQKEVGKMQQDRLSYYAFPIINKVGNPKVVLYLDSASRTVFKTNRIRKIDKIALILAKLT